MNPTPKEHAMTDYDEYDDGREDMAPPTIYKVTFRPTRDPRRAPKAPVTRKLTVLHAFTAYECLGGDRYGDRHYIKFAGVRGYGEVLEDRAIIAIERVA